MRVAVVAEQLRTPIPGGIGTYVDGLSLGLTAIEGLDPVLYASRWNSKTGAMVYDSHGQTIDPLNAYGHEVSRSRLSSKALLRMWDIGLGKVNGSFSALHATSFALPPVENSVPVTMMIHDLGWKRYPNAYTAKGRLWHERSLKRALKKVQHFMVPSSATANDLIAEGVAPGAITVIPLGWDHLPDANDVATDAFLEHIGVSGGFVLAVGTIEPRKNLPGLIRAYELVKDRLNMPLVIVGPRGWGDGLVESPGVLIAGNPPSEVLVGLYRRCSAFASVPLLEGFGLPVLEALSQGAPVLASAVPSAGKATYLVDPHKPVAIADGLVRVVFDAGLRQQLRSAAMSHVENYTWAKSARAHVAIWDSL